MMDELTMKIGGATLKHVVGMLEQVDTEGVFVVRKTGIICKIIDGANAQIVTATIPSGACESYGATGTFCARVDVEWLRKMLDIKMGLFELRIRDGRLHICTGRHHVSKKLIPVEGVRKVPNPIMGDPSVAVGFPGTFLKRVVGYLDESDATGLIIETDGPRAVAMRGLYEDASGCEYSAKGDWLTEWKSDARAIYSTYYLIDIVDLIEDEFVSLAFATDKPVRIGWTHEGCTLEVMLAPRIEST